MERAALIDHLTIPGRDLDASGRFYETALAPFAVETAMIEDAVVRSDRGRGLLRPGR